MPTPVPALDRAVAVLNFLASQPDIDHSLSEVSRATGIHKATCAAALATLGSHGMVHRGDDLRYRLGPAFVGWHFAYAQRHRAFLESRREMWKFVESTGLSCSASALDGDEIVVLDIAGDVNPPHLTHRIGKRLAFRPPHGTIYRVWSEPNEIDAWLEQMVEEYGGDKQDHLATVSAIRTRGYALGSEQDFHVELDAALRQVTEQSAADDVRGVTVAMLVADKIRNLHGFGTDSDDQPVNFVVAPVFGSTGRVLMSLNAFGRPGQIRRHDVSRLGDLLLESTERITRAIGGTLPSS